MPFHLGHLVQDEKVQKGRGGEELNRLTRKGVQFDIMSSEP